MSDFLWIIFMIAFASVFTASNMYHYYLGRKDERAHWAKELEARGSIAKMLREGSK